MKILGIIPARYGSTRFPAKALVDIKGKSMVQRVYEQASKAKYLSKVVVATDHELIYENVKSFGGHVCMTSENHKSGTDRCFEAYEKAGEGFDYVINIQGDEPFIAPDQIDLLASCLDGNTMLGTLIKPIDDAALLPNPNVVKVMVDSNQEAIYFSRSPLPYFRDVDMTDWPSRHQYYKHIGIYAYRADTLKQITGLPVSSLEQAESLEQLRWISHGLRIKALITNIESIGIDTPEDLEAAIKSMGSN